MVIKTVSLSILQMLDLPVKDQSVNPIELCRGIISKRYPKTQLAKTLVPVLIFVFAIGIVSILKATKPEVKARPVLEKQWSVAVLEAKPSNISPRRRFYGEITAGREAELRSEVRGRVIEVNEKFIDGGVVSKGGASGLF